MKKIAFYGKGGIGKSTTAANVAAALSLQGRQVCQVGCDPKNDSTRLLLGHICRETVLDKVRTSDIDSIKAENIVHTGYNGITCVEAGGPEPGVGCAGPLLLLPSVFPSIRDFSNESALRIRWPKYWSFSFS